MVVGRIVVGVDGSEHGRRALRWAQRKAALHGSELTALLAWGLFDQLHDDGGTSFDPDYGPTDAAAALLPSPLLQAPASSTPAAARTVTV